MATESEAGVKLPRGVGILTENVVKSRPDLTDMVGFTVRVPRSLDIEANDGPQRVWVQGCSLLNHLIECFIAKAPIPARWSISPCI